MLLATAGWHKEEKTARRKLAAKNIYQTSAGLLLAVYLTLKPQRREN
jgi:hypothetical protein